MTSTICQLFKHDVIATKALISLLSQEHPCQKGNFKIWFPSRIEAMMLVVTLETVLCIAVFSFLIRKSRSREEKVFYI